LVTQHAPWQKQKMIFNLKISRLKESDREKLVNIIDDMTALLTRLNCPFTLEDADNFIKNYNTWGIKYKGELVGAFEIKKTGETAYVVSSEWRNKGICTKAMESAKLIADKQFNISKLWCYIHPENIPSMRVAQKAGLEIKNVKEAFSRSGYQ